MEQLPQQVASGQGWHAGLHLLQPARALNRVSAQPTAQDWGEFMEYLHNLPPLPEMEGTKTLSEVYEKAKEAARKAEQAAAASTQQAAAIELDASEEEANDSSDSEDSG